MPPANDNSDNAQDDSRDDLIDADGYRKNVGLIVCNHRRQVLWARRVRHDGWQFPQGGVRADESVQQAAFRELQEEIGLVEADVRLLGATDNWLKYEVPHAVNRYQHSARARQFRGQKQRWFLFELLCADSQVRLDCSHLPEFDSWEWVDYWRPLEDIVAFKKPVYLQALTELEPLLGRVNSGGSG